MLEPFQVDFVLAKDFSYTRHKCGPEPTVPRKRKFAELRALPDTAGFLKRVQEVKALSFCHVIGPEKDSVGSKT